MTGQNYIGADVSVTGHCGITCAAAVPSVNLIGNGGAPYVECYGLLEQFLAVNVH